MLDETRKSKDGLLDWIRNWNGEFSDIVRVKVWDHAGNLAAAN